MPEYTFKCDNCDITSTVRRSMSMSNMPLICVECGNAMHMVITGGAGIVFKGDGFHSNDYAEKEMYDVDGDFE